MLTTLILSVAAPTVIATVLIAIGHRLWKSGAPVEAGRWSLAFAPALAGLAAYVAVRSFPELPPTDASEWALWLGLAAAVWGALDGHLDLPPPARWGARLTLSAGTALCVSLPRIEYAWGPGTTTLWLVGATGALLFVWLTIERRGEALPGPVAPTAATVLGFGVATVLGTSGSALLAQAAGGVTTAFGVMAVAGLLRPALKVGRAIAAPTTVVLGGFILAGLHYAEVSAPAALLLLGAVSTLWLSRLGRLPSRGIKAAIAHGALALVLCGAAIGLSVAGTPPTEGAPSDEASDGYDDGYGY